MTETADWTSYLSTQAGAAATLTGLVFVAVSINLSRIISVPGLSGRAAETILQFFGVLIVSTTPLIPRQSTGALGAEILLAGSVLWILQTVLQVIYMGRRAGHPLYWLIVRILQTQFATIPFCIAGILLLRGSSAGLYWLPLGVIFSLISGVVNAWVLLVEILR
jgi:hypothetical protein